MTERETTTSAAQLLRKLMPDSIRNVTDIERETDMTQEQQIVTSELVVARDEQLATHVVDVAADIGNARTIVLVRAGETLREITMPSVRSLRGAFAYEVFARRSLPAASWHALAADEHILRIGGADRFLGRLAVEHAPAASSGRGSDARYSDGTILDFVLAGVAAALPKATRIIVRQLATVVPISLWQMIAQSVEQSLRGAYHYSYNGRDISLKIESVVVRREAESAYAALPKQPKGRALLLDGGGRTHNVAMFLDGEYRKGATIELGVETALDDVDRELVGSGARALSLSERAQLLDALLAGESYTLRMLGGLRRIDTIARLYFDLAARSLVQELYSKVNVDGAEWIEYVGGAAYPQFFGAMVRQLIVDTTTAQSRVALAERPEVYNVYGALNGLGGAPKKVRRVK